MKSIVLLSLLALSAQHVAASESAVRTQDKTITKVVKLLQSMLEKSKKEGDEERKIYAKFKCYCDTSEAEKKAAIEEATKTISTLEAKIAELQGSNGEESSKSAELKASMAENKAAQEEATAIREKQNKAFKAEKADLEQAISQMKDALETLAAVGADQTAGAGADHKQFMAKGASLLSLQSSMQNALAAAESFMSKQDYGKFASFVQAPFTGTYTSQSGQVMGILKSMRDTFEANLATAIETEKSQKEAYDKFMKVKKEAYKQMSDLYDEAQESLGGNDQDLGSKRSQLAESEKSKAEDEEFLEKLIPMCKDKAEDYEKRKVMRTNEEAAVAEAISILNSDDAFETFGGVDATSTGKTSFLQISRHVPEDVKEVMQRLLRRAAAEEGHQAPRLHHIISQLQADNPFDTVLDEIDKMIKLIGDEGKADKENLDWCKKERKENKASLKEKNSEILKLEEKIDKLTTTIEDPKTGLKKQIADTEEALRENDEAQKTQTAERQEANVAYQADVKNLVAAESLLKNAIKVLEAYYDTIDKAFIQSMTNAKEDPAPPKTWEGSYQGQSSKGGDAISMLKFILDETEKEEKEAHADEEKEQADYEDSMTSLKKEQAKKEKSLANLQDTLAEKEQDLLDAEEDLKSTTKDRDAIEAYLEKIKPGCDFITKNFDLREKNRGTEKSALETAKKTLKGSPAYKNAVADATVESYGKCKEPCVKDAAHVKCKACMADVTIPAYCAGHKGTAGC